MTYTAIAAVRNRLGQPRAVYVPDSVRIGDVIKFHDDGNITVPPHDTLGFVHELLPVDDGGVNDRFAKMLGGEIYEATEVWHPEHCAE